MTIRTYATYLALLTVGTLGLFLGMFVQATTNSEYSSLIRVNAVCHAITEDSDISDCDYRNGAWYTK